MIPGGEKANGSPKAVETRSTHAELHSVPVTVVSSDLALFVSSDSAIALPGSAGTVAVGFGGAPGSPVICAVTVVVAFSPPLASKSPVQSNVLPDGSTVVFATQLKPFDAATAGFEIPGFGSATRT